MRTRRFRASAKRTQTSLRIGRKQALEALKSAFRPAENPREASRRACGSVPRLSAAAKHREDSVSDNNKIVAHFISGKVIKGTTRDFFPQRPLFHIQAVDQPNGPEIEVRCKEIKALFFVRDYAGNSKRQDLRGFITAPGETQQGKKLAVRFRDGELICGYSLTYAPDRQGFIIFPADPGSNNERIYVQTAAAAEVASGSNAESLALKVLSTRAA